MKVKVILLKRKVCSVLACLAVAAGIFYVVNFPPAVGAAVTTRQLPIYCVQRDQKLVAISFDAAWGNEDTEELIEILGNYKVKATFFVVGEWVDKYPQSVKALYDAGHEVMNHSNTHAHYPQLSADEVVADLNACNDKIEKVTGVRPMLVRLPYGDYDDNSINAVRSIGMEPIQWDVDVSATASRDCAARILFRFLLLSTGSLAYRIHKKDVHKHLPIKLRRARFVRARRCYWIGLFSESYAVGQLGTVAWFCAYI